MDVAGPLSFLSVGIPLSVSNKGKDTSVGGNRPRVCELFAQGGWLRAWWLLASERRGEHFPLLTPGVRMLPMPRPGMQTEPTTLEAHIAAIAEARRPK